MLSLQNTPSLPSSLPPWKLLHISKGQTKTKDFSLEGLYEKKFVFRFRFQIQNLPSQELEFSMCISVVEKKLCRRLSLDHWKPRKLEKFWGKTNNNNNNSLTRQYEEFQNLVNSSAYKVTLNYDFFRLGTCSSKQSAWRLQIFSWKSRSKCPVYLPAVTVPSTGEVLAQ